MIRNPSHCRTGFSLWTRISTYRQLNQKSRGRVIPFLVANKRFTAPCRHTHTSLRFSSAWLITFRNGNGASKCLYKSSHVPHLYLFEINGWPTSHRFLPKGDNWMVIPIPTINSWQWPNFRRRFQPPFKIIRRQCGTTDCLRGRSKELRMMNQRVYRFT